MAVLQPPKKIKIESVEDFLKQELSTTIKEFTDKSKPWLIKHDLAVTLLVMNGPYYPVYE